MTALLRMNLPIQPTPVIGRERELKEVTELIASHRLLTLTGPGGSGKTRLALQLGADVGEQFPDGVFWVPLQAIRDPALVEGAIASGVGAEGDLVDYIGNKELLVVLDNFEQVIEAASAVSSVLAGTPNAKVLVTSREPLHLAGERCYPVDPLSQGDAEVLFIERAGAVDPGFQATKAVGDICRRVDGLPLAIELAAARVALLEPHELLARLDRRLALLASRSPDAPARQRTLRATIAWSYELLEPAEQELFRCLAVFAGSFSLEAAERVCDADLDVLESLILKNLVRRWGGGRFGMLDTIRDYALERLGDTPEVDNVQRRHAEFFLTLAESAHLNAGVVKEGERRFDIVSLDQHNIRGALSWAVTSGAIDIGLQIAIAIEEFWVLEHPQEGMRWFAALFEHSEAQMVAPEIRAHALRAYSSCMHIAGYFDRAEDLCEQSLALFDQLEDQHGRAVLLHRLGLLAMLRGALERASELVNESHQIHERTGDLWGQVQTVSALGAIARDGGDHERAFELIERSAEMARQGGVPFWQGGMLAELACLSVNAGHTDEAEAYARQSLALAEELGDRAGRVFGVGILAVVAALRGELERAGILWGAIENEVAFAPLGGWQHHRDRFAARVGDGDGVGSEEARARGRELTLDDAVSLVLAPSESFSAGDDVAPASPSAIATATMVREGEYVTISSGDEVVRLRASKGIAYLATLLESPGREFHVLELASPGDPRRARSSNELELGGDGAGAALDPKAKAAYKRRIDELRSDIEEAESFGDSQRATRAREEVEFITQQLVSAVGLGGRDRPTGSDAERARVNVTKRIKATMRKVSAGAPRLGRHLDLTVKTGVFMSYSDHIEPTLAWEIDLRTEA